MPAPKLSIDGVALLRLAGNYNTPTWTEIELARDVQLTPAWDEAEAFSRETVMKEFAKNLLDVSVTLSVRSATGDPAYDALMDAFLDRKGIVDLLILDDTQTTNGAEGFRFDAGVFSASQDQSLSNGVVYREFGIKPSAFRENKAKSATVVNNVPVFSDIS